MESPAWDCDVPASLRAQNDWAKSVDLLDMPELAPPTNEDDWLSDAELKLNLELGESPAPLKRLVAAQFPCDSARLESFLASNAPGKLQKMIDEEKRRGEHEGHRRAEMAIKGYLSPVTNDKLDTDGTLRPRGWRYRGDGTGAEEPNCERMD